MGPKMKDLPTLKNERHIVRQKVTRKTNALLSKIDTLTKVECGENIERLNELKISLQEEDNVVARLIMATEGEDLDVDLAESEEFEEKIYISICKLKERLNSLEISTVVQESSSYAETLNKLKLPEIPLPTFANEKGENIIQFFVNFEDVLNKYKLSGYERFVYLERQLSGDPLSLIKSLTGVQRCYIKAKELLNSAFARPIKNRYATIRNLANLKFNTKSPYAFVSEFRLLISSFEELEIDIKTVLQYFIWSCLPTEYQDQLNNLTRNSYPDLDEINKNMFEAIDLVNEKNETLSVAPEPVSLAANISPNLAKIKSSKPYKPCTLCDYKNADHPIFKCQSFPKARDKLDKLKALGMCIKCANFHPTKECKYKFHKACTQCNKSNHFSFLCFKEGDKTNTSPAKEVANGVCAVEFSAQNSMCPKMGNLLPTFSCTTKNGLLIRGLQDSGAQTSFIQSDVAKTCNFKVIKSDVNLTIRGFNERKTIKTNIVEVEVKIGNTLRSVPAVCVPSLTKILPNSENANIAKILLSKGYKMADSYILSDPLKDIDIILGIDSFHYLELSSINFGKKQDSCMLSSVLGIMPIGNSKEFYKNLERVPSYSCGSSNLTLGLVEAEPGVSGLSEELGAVEPAVAQNSETCGQEKSEFEITTLFIACDQRFEHLSNEVPTVRSGYLEDKCAEILNYDNIVEDEMSQIDKEQCSKVLSSITRDEGKNMVVPLLWHDENAHLLAKNLNLCKQILKSIKTKLDNIPGGLRMVDEVIREQIDSNVIEPIDDLDEFLKNNRDCSFLAHMPVFKASSNTTKCRVVYLSNLKEKKTENAVSHNQSLLPGPQMNRPIETSLTLLRFDKNLLIYDLKKAFLQLKLNSDDSNKLCFLWFKDAANNNFELQAYRCLRLPFGLRSSPSLLMLSLFYMLVFNVQENDDLKFLKGLMYELLYMDNGGITSNESLIQEFETLPKIFEPYGFEVQEFASNDETLTNQFPHCFEEKSPKLLGMKWDTKNDTLGPPKFNLDPNAQTKRSILSSIAGNYDLFNIGGPMLNRARLLMHDLQNDPKLKDKWDVKLDKPILKNWQNIAKQINDAPEVKINRFVGSRDGTYDILAYVDASKHIYGAVLYILDKNSGKISYLLAKNRLIAKNLKEKSIASLELLAIEFGTKLLQKVYNDLAGSKTMFPINIQNLKLFSDSTISLDWIRSHAHTFDKMNRKPVFIMNRLNAITKECNKKPVEFNFISGQENVADCITRTLSFKVLSKSRYWIGPTFESVMSYVDPILVPNTNMLTQISVCAAEEIQQIVDHDRFSSFAKLSKVYFFVLKFAKKMLKTLKNENTLEELEKNENTLEEPFSNAKCHRQALTELFLRDQENHYPEIKKYFLNKPKNLKDIPNLVSQLNVFQDHNGVLRVKTKISHIGKKMCDFPILLSKKSHVTHLIIKDIHRRLNHSGKYSVLAELRKNFYLPNCFSTVKNILKLCTICKRFNSKPISLNQNEYRKFRNSPENTPFRNLALDYLGPISIKIKGEVQKVYLLVFSCLWSRAINLQICLDLSVTNFVRAFSLHVHRNGLPSLVLSDSGSNIIAGSKFILNNLNDPETIAYLDQNGIKSLKFDQYPKGCNKLGGLIEICVKMVKRLIFGAVGRSIVSYSDFEFLVSECTQIVNKRPICLLESLRDTDSSQSVPTALTPELILHGHELVSPSLIPQEEEVWRPPGSPKLLFENLSNIRKALYEIYESEFVNTLVSQASEVPKRYKPKTHRVLKVGDIVLIKEVFIKRANLPLARVLEVTSNGLGEVTEVTLKKGKSGEVVRRHVSSLIPYLESNESVFSDQPTARLVESTAEPVESAARLVDSISGPVESTHRPVRNAAVKAARQIRTLADSSRT